MPGISGGGCRVRGVCVEIPGIPARVRGECVEILPGLPRTLHALGPPGGPGPRVWRVCGLFPGRPGAGLEPWVSFRKNPLFGAFPRDLARLRSRSTPPALRALARATLAAVRGGPPAPTPPGGGRRGPCAWPQGPSVDYTGPPELDPLIPPPL